MTRKSEDRKPGTDRASHLNPQQTSEVSETSEV